MNCKKCNNKFEPSKGLINYCSLKCRNSKERSQEVRKKISDALKIKISDIEINNFILFYNKTKSLEETAKEFGFSKQFIRKFLPPKEKRIWNNIKEKNIFGVTSWRKRTKQKLVEYAGGKCCKCGYDKCNAALEFHHIDPAKKDFAIGNKGKTNGFEGLKKEVDKCILVCSNCHREIHAGLIII